VAFGKKKTSKRSRKKQRDPIDYEALGLVLLGLGVFLGASLVPLFETGELGNVLRGSLAGRVGWGAYTLLPPLFAAGGLLLLRQKPKGWWGRILLGYGVVMLGLWLLLVLVSPRVMFLNRIAASGRWGVTLAQNLSGSAGWLAYILALLVLTLGMERLMKLPPTSLVRRGSRYVVTSVHNGLQAFWRLRNRAKLQAAFYADKVLAQKSLKQLEFDLNALRELYNGSVELDSWRTAVKNTLRKLEKRPSEDDLLHIQEDIRVWQDAVRGFSGERAGELRPYIQAEGIVHFAESLTPLREQLAVAFRQPTDDKADVPLAAITQLDTLRHSLDLDLTALGTRYRKLTRERDLAEQALSDVTPGLLVKLYDQHHERSRYYQQIADACEAVAQASYLLEQWRPLAKKLQTLHDALPQNDAITGYSDNLADMLRTCKREGLIELDNWQQSLEQLINNLPADETVIQHVQEAAVSHNDQPDTKDDTDTVFGSTLGIPLEDLFDVDDPQDLLAEDDPADTTPAADTTTDTNDDVESVYGTPEEDAIPADGALPLQHPRSNLLDALGVAVADTPDVMQELVRRKDKIEETLRHFKLEGTLQEPVRGPSVTRFEIKPAPGEKISRYANLSNDLALAMAVGSVRIEAPIPGKSVIGLEVPNATRDLVRFREAIESPAFQRSKARIPLVLGKSIEGEFVVGDLSSMPHVLIAGSTGSGKSVAINTLIGSMVFRFLPTDLRLLMIDPKMVELTPYERIPHLIRPVVTNPNDAAGVLLGAVAHMERRYKMMSKIGAKTLAQYNAKARDLDMPEMPTIVIIIDELADLMITSPKEVESAIMRLAQMARATGMHLILATQRPSVDILTSLIKVNVPARLAFAVSSGHDSRTILDSLGAERLTGLGDMLFYQPGLAKPLRLQGPYTSEEDISSVSDFLRRSTLTMTLWKLTAATSTPFPLMTPPPRDSLTGTMTNCAKPPSWRCLRVKPAYRAFKGGYLWGMLEQGS
jgi:S-DNA-T family DNA segregation ATPase FtsK/SpoIIIE